MEIELESPLETILFGFSASIACFLWAFITLLTVALSLWRLRSPFPKPAYSSATPASPLTPETTSTAPEIVAAERPDNSYSGEVGFPKGIFTAYFCAEEEFEQGERMRMGNGYNQGLGLLDFGWRGDLGWYQYQDRTAINGTVVRLWDAGRGVAMAG